MSSLCRYKTNLGVERLEQREVLSIAYRSGGMLTIEGSNYADNIDVRELSYSKVDSWIYVEGAPIRVGSTSYGLVPASWVSNIRVYAGGGNDTIRLDSERLGGFHRAIYKPATIHGGTGDDYILSGKGNDMILPNVGNDWVGGNDGNDVINDLDGNDYLYGGAGNDSIYANAGNDLLYGGQGNDLLVAGSGNDELWGDAGNDRLYGEGGSDWLWGGHGYDLLDGGSGIDFAWGGLWADDFVNLSDLSSGTGFYSPITFQYAAQSGIQDFSAAEGDRRF